jgi:Ubiquitin carboxyl-terminal hydrolase
MYSEEDEKLSSDQMLQQKFLKKAVYELKAVILQVKHPYDASSDEEGHLVSLIKMSKAQLEQAELSGSGQQVISSVSSDTADEDTLPSVPSIDAASQPSENEDISGDYTSKNWYLFNDFLVKKVGNDVLNFSYAWKTPCVLIYTRKDLDHIVPKVAFHNPINAKIAFGIVDASDAENGDVREQGNAGKQGRKGGRGSKTSSPAATVAAAPAIEQVERQMQKISIDDIPRKGDIVALDAEFVILEGNNRGAKIS